MNRNFVCLVLAPKYLSSEIDILAQVFPIISRESHGESMIGLMQLVSSDEVSSDDVSTEAASFWGWKTQRQVYPPCTWIVGNGSTKLWFQRHTIPNLDMSILITYCVAILTMHFGGVNELTFQAYAVVKRQITPHWRGPMIVCPENDPGLKNCCCFFNSFQDRKEETWIHLLRALTPALQDMLVRRRSPWLHGKILLATDRRYPWLPWRLGFKALEGRWKSWLLV